MFEFFFKYPTSFFRDGSVELAAPWWLYGGIVLATFLVLPSLFLYAKVQGEANARDRYLLTALRTAVVSVMVFSLFKPVLVVPLSSDERNVVGVLFDDSRSLRIADQDGQPRHSVIQAQFSSEDGNLRAELAHRFDLRLYRFGAEAEPIANVTDLTFAEGATDLGKALSQIRNELSGLPLAAVVVVSDGAHNAGNRLDVALAELRAAAVPIHTVGVGRETYTKDLEIGAIEVPATVLQDSNLVIAVPVQARGFAGLQLPVIAEEDGQILDTGEIEVEAGGAVAMVRMKLKLAEPGLRRLRVRVPLQEGETVAENNRREFFIEVRGRAERVLHFEGEPRFEVKFLRRALSDDPNLQLVSLIRTAENKFYRLGLDDPDELAAGFPTERQALFQYRALILGSVEATHFSAAQLDMIADFVSERGGGLLLLGGRRAFAEGGFQDTALAEVSPMLLETRRGPIVPLPARVRPTPTGLEHPITRIMQAGRPEAARWSALPPLTVVNPIRRLKLGATPLLWAAGPDNSEPLQILAVQRFGRGRVAAFPVRNAWQWKMHPDVDPEDETLPIFWRQLLRWLVQSTPDRLQVQAPRGVAPNETVTVTAELRGADFALQSNARPRLSVRSPSGAEETLAMEPRPTVDGGYQARFDASERGLYELRAKVGSDDQDAIQDRGYLRAHPEVREYHGAEMQASLLKRIAADSGGRFYTPETLGSLPTTLLPSSSGANALTRLDLWNMPFLLVLTVLLLGAEWFYRRWRGLI